VSSDIRELVSHQLRNKSVERVSTLQTLVASSGDSARAKRFDAEQRGARVGRVVGAVIAALAIVLASGGLRLLMLGGSSYYSMSGIGYVVCGVLLWRRRPAGAWSYLFPACFIRSFITESANAPCFAAISVAPARSSDDT
jgi:hypothetical protein